MGDPRLQGSGGPFLRCLLADQDLPEQSCNGCRQEPSFAQRRDDALQRPGRRLIWRVLSVGCTFNQPQVVICLLLPVLAPILTVTAWIYSRSHPGIVLVVMEGCASFCQPWSLQL